jgi:peptide/nickel transport system permease protein
LTRYILRKILYGILVLWGVVTLVFGIFSINPGDPARMLLGQRVDEAALASINKELGLDLPTYKQYFLYLNDVSPLSFHKHGKPDSRVYLDAEKYQYLELIQLGQWSIVLKAPYLRKSFQNRKPVSEIIREALPGTFILASFAILFALVIGVLVGVITAINKDTFIDHFSLFTAVIGMSAPSFFSAIILSWLGGYLWSAQINLPAIPLVFMLIGLVLVLANKKWRSIKRAAEWSIKGLLIGFGIQLIHSVMAAFLGGTFIVDALPQVYLPGTGLNMTGSLYDVDVFEGEYISLSNLILPLITLGIRPLAVVVQLTRNSMLEVLSQDYIRTARAKGLSQSSIVLKHALRNALNPVLTAVSGWFASMLAGAVFIEFVFNWKGIGLQVFQSLQNDDYPVVMGSVLVIASAFVLINIMVDILYGWLDPRIRLK